jgi:CRP/FNR family transcriptional regulator, cyclic AMP receptor protein
MLRVSRSGLTGGKRPIDVSERNIIWCSQRHVPRRSGNLSGHQPPDAGEEVISARQTMVRSLRLGTRDVVPFGKKKVESRLLMVQFMINLKTLRATDLERLGRLSIFSWLTPSELKELSASLAKSNYARGELIVRESALANQAHVLIAGIARITCLNADNERVTIALIAPGPIPELLSLPTNRFDFRCEAYSDCRVGTLDWKGFDRITLNGCEAAFRKFHHNDLKHWYRLLRRTSAVLNLDLHERVALTMLDLCEDFGIEDSRGTLLTVSISQKDIASIVGASRPRITEHLAQMERDHLLVRQGRQFIVNTAQLSIISAAHPLMCTERDWSGHRTAQKRVTADSQRARSVQWPTGSNGTIGARPGLS